MENLIEKVKFVILEKTEETISIESLIDSECDYHFQDAEIDYEENQFKGKLFKIEFKKEGSSEIVLYIQSSERPDKGIKKMDGRIGYLHGEMVVHIPKAKIE